MLAKVVRPIFTPKRRWAQFSLGTLFVGVTVLCMWLGWCVDQARRQCEAITELHKLHVAVLYHHSSSKSSPRGNIGVGERLLGAAFREPVDYVGFQQAHRLFDDPPGLEKALSLLPHIRGLKRLNLEGMPITDSQLNVLKSLTDLRKVNLIYTDVTDAGVAELGQALPNCEITR